MLIIKCSFFKLKNKMFKCFKNEHFKNYDIYISNLFFLIKIFFKMFIKNEHFKV